MRCTRHDLIVTVVYLHWYTNAARRVPAVGCSARRRTALRSQRSRAADASTSCSRRPSLRFCDRIKSKRIKSNQIETNRDKMESNHRPERAVLRAAAAIVAGRRRLRQRRAQGARVQLLLRLLLQAAILKSYSNPTPSMFLPSPRAGRAPARTCRPCSRAARPSPRSPPRCLQCACSPKGHFLHSLRAAKLQGKSSVREISGAQPCS